jgi:NB-ARC domain
MAAGTGTGGRWSHRRLLWLVLGMVGLAGVGLAGLWLAHELIVFLHQRLGKQSAQAGVANMFIAAATFLVSLIALILALVQSLRGASSRLGSRLGTFNFGLVPPGQAMVSLVAPEGLLEERVRGRGQLIGELARLYGWRGRRAGRVHVLHGLGGCGKTTVALSVARMVRSRNVEVWWVSASTATDVQAAMRQLTRHLGADDQELDRAWAGLDSAPDLLWHRLRAYRRRWLLVMDNADDPRLLAAARERVAGQRGWIRPVASRRGAILVTSRDGEQGTWGNWCALNSVGMLSTADGAQVLLDHAGEQAGTPVQAAALAARLGGLALALRLAGAYLADADRIPLPGSITTFTAYQEALEAGTLGAVFDHPAGSLSEAETRNIIGQTWELSLAILDDRGLGQARTLLRLLSILANAPVPYQLLLDPAVMAASPLFPALDELRMRELLHALAGVALIDLDSADPGPPTLRLHPLVRDITRYRLAQSGRDSATYLELAVQLLYQATDSRNAGNPDDPGTWPVWQTPCPSRLVRVQRCLLHDWYGRPARCNDCRHSGPRGPVSGGDRALCRREGRGCCDSGGRPARLRPPESRRPRRPP